MRCLGGRLIAGLTAGLIAATAIPIHANRVSAATGPAARALQLINQSRAVSGMAPVRLDAGLSAIAQNHAQRMAAQGRLFHNPSFPSQAMPWTACGENVGAGVDADAIHRGFMAEREHRANVLNRSYNLVGIGVAAWAGKIMVVEDFVARAGAPVPPPPSRAPAPKRPAAPPPPPPPPPPEPAQLQPVVSPLSVLTPYVSLYCQGTSLGCLVLLTVEVVLDSSDDPVVILDAAGAHQPGSASLE